jgi:predicted transcriptional regulator
MDTDQHPPRPPHSHAELDALKALWELGPSPAGDVRAALRLRGREWAYTTTKTILDRLEEKGYVRRERSGTPHVYMPIVTADGVARERLEEIRNDLFAGRDLPLVRALLDGVRLSAEEIAELRASLDSMETADGRDK